jgi:putative DNA primase/helicase
MDERIIKLAEHQAAAANEDGLALLFATAHALDLRYVAVWGQWMSWDGAQWQQDKTLHTFDRIRALCQGSAVKVTAPAVASVEKLARSDRRLAATDEQWDATGWAINTGDNAVTNSTFDLRTGGSHPPDPLDYITKKAACHCAPLGTPHPRWTKFLERVTGSNAELIGFLRRWCGYCCTGFTNEHVFAFAYGTGANGKSTFINTVHGIMGDYAAVADMSTFLASNAERHPTDLAKLRGARLVVAIETQKGRRWDETKIKALTGGDRISARFMRQDFFDFTPNFKLLICGNHKPRLTSIDEAMKRRLLLVPFTVQIPVAERDKDLADKLKGEWPAILRWMINGCLDWQRVGLAPPKTVLDATEEYFAEQDTLQQWLDECTEDGGSLARTRTADLFASWKDWCETRNFRPGSATAFSTALADKGFKKARNAAGQMTFGGLVPKVR